MRTETTTYYGLTDIAEAIGEDGLHDLVESRLDRHYFDKDEGGHRIMRMDWGYEALSALEKDVAKVANLMEWGARTNPEEVFEAIYSKVAASSDYLGWFEGNEHFAYQELLDDAKPAILEALEEALAAVPGETGETGEERVELDIDYLDWRYHLEDKHGVYYDYGLKEALEGCRIRADVMLAVPGEANRDFTSINAATWAAYLLEDCDDLPSREEFASQDADQLKNNSLNWFLGTQGLGFDDLVAGRTPLCQSILGEVGECHATCPQMAFLADMSIGDYCRLASGGSLEVDPSAPGIFTMGLFDKINGSGGVMELDASAMKPFVIDGTVVDRVIAEGAKSVDCYSVNEVFGLVGECWTDCVSATEKKALPVPEVDMGALYDSLKAVEDREGGVPEPVAAVTPSLGLDEQQAKQSKQPRQSAPAQRREARQ